MGLSSFLRATFKAKWMTIYWFSISETFTFLFYFSEINSLSYWTVSYNHFQNSIHFRFIAILGVTLRLDKILIFNFLSKMKSFTHGKLSKHYKNVKALQVCWTSLAPYTHKNHDCSCIKISRKTLFIVHSELLMTAQPC